MQAQNPYEQKYKQLNLLGKGNFGKVYKVRLNNGKEGKDASYFVAKKMFLEGLTQEEIRFAYGEIQILQKLNDEIKKNKVPFIVGYEEFFRIENELIIIMEYCEQGDLSSYLKLLRKNNQRLSEKIIGYWFTQLLFGLRVLHNKNILHRDLKSANIFLTKNYSLKIGDFGISKVLEKSSAITCIGTPLYLSPEVCNNQPYSYSSDLWALACIVYEMCSLRYPFQASNMIVLAKKIVMDKVEPIPHYFDRELNSIIMSNMFEKDPKKRMSVDQIFKTPYFNRLAKNFIQDQGRIKELATPIDLDQPKTEEKVVTAEQEETMKTINSVVQRTGGNETLTYTNTLTPKEKQALKKEEERKKTEELMAKAARENLIQNQQHAKESKIKNLMQTTGASGLAKTQKVKREIEIQSYNRAVSQLKNKQKKEKQQMNWAEKLQELPVAGISNTINNITIKDAGEEEFEDVPPLPGNSSFVPVPIEVTKTVKKNNQSKLKHKFQDEIHEQIQQEEDQDLQEYYDDDFEEYVEPTVTQKIEIKKQEQDIMSFYENQVGITTMSPTKKSMVQQALRPIQFSTASKIKGKELDCINLVGQKRFRQLKTMFIQGKIDKNGIQKNPKFSAQQKKSLFYIEQIIELQQQM